MNISNKSFSRCILVFLQALLIIGCQGAGGGPDHAPLDERLGPGQVRAGVITSTSELLEGPEAQGGIGDFKIYNNKAAFIIQNIDLPRGWGPYGGSLLDADIIRPEGEPGHDTLQEVFLQVGMLTLFPESAEVIANGSDGQAALVRITGRDQGIPELDAAIDGAIEPRDLHIVHDYILEPDVNYLRIRTSIVTNGRAAIKLDVGDVVLNGDKTTDFVPGKNFTGSGIPQGEHAYLAGADPAGCNLYTGIDGSIQATFGLHEVALLKVIEDTVPTAGDGVDPLVAERIFMVGDGGLDACLRILDAYKGEPNTSLLSGNISDNSGRPEAGLMVFAGRASEPAGDIVDQTYTDEDGAFEMQLTEGDYKVWVRPTGREAVSSETVQAGQSLPVRLTVSEPAMLRYHCEDEGGDLLPCKISMQAGHEAAMNSPVAMDSLTFGATGEGSFIVPPGDWTVTLSRGWEYGLHRENVTTAAGQTIDVSGVLTRQVNTAGYIAADLHTHCTRSIDSTYDIEDKIASNIVEAIELVVITDHDCSTNFASYIEHLGEKLSFDPARWITAVTGNEISPHFGHSTAFPMPTHPTGFIYWQVPWTVYKDGRYVRHLEYPEIWPYVRTLGVQVINAAHPLSYNAWFKYLGFDPPNVIPRLDSLPTDKFSSNFDTIELLNKKDVDLMLENVLPLWSSMNNQGVFKTAIGVSDSHQRDAEAGFGRTLIVSSSDEPQDIDLDQIWSNLKKRRAAVGGGIFVSIEIAGSRPGDLLSSPGPLDVRLHVEAADWVPASRFVLLANGETIESLELAPPGQVDPAHPAVRYDGKVSVSPAVDTWYAAVAYAEKGATLDPVFRGCRPAGMTNAVQVDVDGNNRFDPPDN